MTRGMRALHSHADALVERELRRLVRLPPEERDAVADVARRVTSAVLEGILDHARHDARVAHSLLSIYGSGD